MSIFESLGNLNLAETEIDPKTLFRMLPKPSGSPYQYPHDIQTDVWNKWFARREANDLIIKMNTGSGKTVIGLLILKSSLNEGFGPALYLVPNTQLKAQVEQTANGLGIRYAESLRDPEFLAGRSILITTVHKVFNGKSQFGIRGVSAEHVELGSIIIDDAHSSIPIINQQFTMHVSSSAPQYNELQDLFIDSLKTQSMNGYTAIVDGDATQSISVPVPYWVWHKNHEKVYTILNQYVTVNSSSDSGAQFSWPLIRENLELCDVAFSVNEIEIRLPYPDLTMVPSFENAKRRIYMTATLSDDSVLVTHMGASIDCVSNPIIPDSAGDMGDRIILTPMQTSSCITYETVKKNVQQWSESMNIVVIVPSFQRASSWSQYTKEIHNKESIRSVVQRLNHGHVGLVVLVARYDGIDLPGDACRILILDGLPEQYSPLDLAEATALSGTERITAQQVQRIEQGMGRGVRSSDDYCAVILLDARLVNRLYAGRGRSYLSPATRAQYELSEKFTNRERNQDISFFKEVIEAFLRRDSNWVNASKRALSDVSYEKQNKEFKIAQAEHVAFESVLAGCYDDAAKSLSSIYSCIADSRYRGWIKQRGASYIDLVDPVSAQRMQRSARADNSLLLKIPGDASSHKLQQVTEQSLAVVDYINQMNYTADEFSIYIDSLLLGLTPTTEHGSSEKFEQAFKKLGGLLGFSSSRPDKESGNGPDNFWVMGERLCWVVEAKSESNPDSQSVSREYLRQLSGSADWFESTLGGHGANYVPIIICPSRVPEWNAFPRKNARVMTFNRLAEFRKALRGFVTAITSGDNFINQRAVSTNLEQFNLMSNQLTQKWTQNFRSRAEK